MERFVDVGAYELFQIHGFFFLCGRLDGFGFVGAAEGCEYCDDDEKSVVSNDSSPFVLLLWSK